MSKEAAIGAAKHAVRHGHASILHRMLSILVPGTALDVYSWILMMAAVHNRMSGDERHDSRAWPMSTWNTHINSHVDMRKTDTHTYATGPVVSTPKPPLPAPPQPVSSGPPGKLPPPPPPPTPPGGGGGPMIPAPPSWLGPAEREAWIQARTRGGELARGLGNYVERKTGDLVAEVWDGEDILRDVDPAKRAEYVELIREKTADAVAHGKTADTLASELGHATGDWARNWRRIALTEMQGAHNEGIVIDAVRTDGADALIARVPDQSACEHCRRVFLEGGKPVIFSAKTLVDNGTNAGRRAKNWLPTVWPVHPNCRCDTVSIPPGFTLDANWDLVFDESESDS